MTALMVSSIIDRYVQKYKLNGKDGECNLQLDKELNRPEKISRPVLTLGNVEFRERSPVPNAAKLIEANAASAGPVQVNAGHSVQTVESLVCAKESSENAKLQ